ncbi:right-handed parallel beta-helix repeat-containing protein [Haloarchaeobius sp. HME9146]|uniref:right-handed parallel beta-helix repeat-containing protein n=1 Tax=Haloarchaeobius sp. HME9146 TaxID=2978732 RepID=UPI0021C1F38E|nr:right-handed parallel beta-helix repeat-containing protein [Haloarchaeobius sp. HME9146]MCT9095286.1 right-handed parallel beta-helix repeat-containing protein [Haloarchaeobius sp. HME9146]
MSNYDHIQTEDENGNTRHTSTSEPSFKAVSLGGGPPVTEVLGVEPPDGKIYADDGNTYSDPSAAESAASEYLVFGAGSFDTLQVNTADLSVWGMGNATVIDPGFGYGIDVDAAGVSIRNLRIDSPSSAVDLSGGDLTLENLNITSGQQGVWSTGSVTVRHCVFEATGYYGLNLRGPDNLVEWCRFRDGITQGAVRTTDNDNIVANCRIDGPGEDALLMSGNNDIIQGNRISNAGWDGIDVQGSDQIVALNRVSGSGASNINSGTNTTLSGNLTG